MTSNGGNLELALRITADLKQGRQEIDRLGESLSDIGNTAAQASTELEGLGTQQPDTDGLQQIHRAAIDIAEGTRHAEQSTARLRFAATGLMADMQALDEGLARSAAGFEEIAAQEERLDRLMRAGALTEKEYQKALDTLDKQEAALIATRDKGEKALGALLTRYDPASAALRRLADDEKALEAALASGGLSLDRYNKAMNGLKVQRAQWQAQQDGAKGFADALEQLNLKSAGAQRELGVLLKNVASGDWSMAQQNLMTLANRAGIMPALMNPAALAVGAVAAAVGVLAVAAYQGYQENERLNTSIIATGNYAGATAAGVRQMAQTWGVNNGEIGKTRRSDRIGPRLRRGAGQCRSRGAGHVRVDRSRRRSGCGRFREDDR